ncbi:hypothetical protein EVAR_16632_1 [Eumeta japonica]|uniref:Uncharacterized protein n=1 Tax=Eumeta variegata TaxID=151549 RepID=A0A4C1UZF3_EUMVA|nr:hypothetical protein EVAR_16632_1 [Eumeta japonica]
MKLCITQKPGSQIRLSARRQCNKQQLGRFYCFTAHAPPAGSGGGPGGRPVPPVSGENARAEMSGRWIDLQRPPVRGTVHGFPRGDPCT